MVSCFFLYFFFFFFFFFGGGGRRCGWTLNTKLSSSLMFLEVKTGVLDIIPCEKGETAVCFEVCSLALIKTSFLYHQPCLLFIT